MTPVEKYDLALVRYLDGQSSPAEVEELNALLTANPQARDNLRAMAAQIIGVNELARERLAQDRHPSSSTNLRHPAAARTLWLDRRWWAAAASLALIVSAAVLWMRPDARGPMTITQVTGSVALIAGDGTRSTDVQAETTFANGTVVVEGETASIAIRLPDGSLVTLNGPSELTIPRTRDEPLGLRQGSLSARVQPQPAGRPLRFRTPTAEVEVLGTHLRVDAQSAETMLVVDEGSVRLKRLVDAAVIVVKQGELANATLETQTALTTQRFAQAPTTWEPSFVSKPSGNWHGRWIFADGDVPGRMQAELDLSYRSKDGTPVPAYQISAKSGSAGLVAVQADSQLHLRFRQQRDDEILVLLSLRKPSGEFAGNFQIKLAPKTISADAQGWRSWTIPLTKLTNGGWPKGATMLVGNRVGLVYVACYSPKAKLEIAEMSIGPVPGP
jgi:FecR protein